MDGKKILLHSCCGPCSTAVLERLKEEGYEPTVFFFNPNITDRAEYEKRLENQKKALEHTEAELIEGRYEPREFFERVKGYEGEKEGGARCELCFEMRLRESAKTAKELGFGLFDSSLSVSPHKNYDKIKEIGESLAEEYGLDFLGLNYKKKDGYRRSVELSKEYGLYRQNYCGCDFSKYFNEKRED